MADGTPKVPRLEMALPFCKAMPVGPGMRGEVRCREFFIEILRNTAATALEARGAGDGVPYRGRETSRFYSRWPRGRLGLRRRFLCSLLSVREQSDACGAVPGRGLSTSKPDPPRHRQLGCPCGQGVGLANSLINPCF